MGTVDPFSQWYTEDQFGIVLAWPRSTKAASKSDQSRRSCQILPSVTFRCAHVTFTHAVGETSLSLPNTSVISTSVYNEQRFGVILKGTVLSKD